MRLFTPKEIAALRRSLGLSVVQFARRLGVNRQTVYYWENGHCHPRYWASLRLNEMFKQARISEPV